MHDESKTILKSLAAIVFLGILGAFLARPIFSADTADPTPEPKSRVVKRTPKEKPTPKPTSSGTKELVLVDRYPKQCLQRVPRPTGIGLIAVGGRQVTVGTPTTVVATFPGKAPIVWSASGRYLALAGSDVWDASSRTKDQLVPGPMTFTWAWSPTADCMVGVMEDGRLIAVTPGSRPVTLVPSGVETFSFSQNGRYLQVSLDNEKGTVIDLRRHREWKRAPVSALDFDGPGVCYGNGAGLSSSTCSHDGRFVAAIRVDNPGVDDRSGRLVLLQGGRVLRELTTGSDRDAYPEWGPAGTGILFLRLPPTEDSARVWYLPEGGRPGATPLAIPNLTQFHHENFRSTWVVDWSLTPPSGEPICC